LQAARQLRDPAGRLQAVIAWRSRYGDIAHTRILGKDYYLLNHPEMVKQVLVGDAEHFRSMPIGKRANAAALRPDVVAEDTQFHKQQRKLLQPAFTPAAIARYGGTMHTYADQMASGWQAGSAIDAVPQMKQVALRIVARALFDSDVTNSGDSIAQAVTLGMEYLAGQNRLPWFIPTRQNRQLIGAWLRMDKSVKDLVAERHRDPTPHNDLLTALFAANAAEEGFALSDKQVHDTVMGMLIAGYETTANALSWALYLLASRPEIQQRARDEANDTDSAQEYITAIIKEAMRLYPPAWAITRYCVKPAMLAGYEIPVGATLFMSAYEVQRDARFFAQPEQFTPERWLNGADKQMTPYAYFPFGGGAHVCIGQFLAMLEARIVLAAVLKRWRTRGLHARRAARLDYAATGRSGAASARERLAVDRFGAARESARNQQRDEGQRKQDHARPDCAVDAALPDVIDK